MPTTAIETNRAAENLAAFTGTHPCIFAFIHPFRASTLVDEDWRGRDPDALRAVAVREVPLLPWATHCFVSATLTRDARHPLGRLLGDILVPPASAAGRGRTRRIPFREVDGRHIGGAHHFALLNDPEVYEHPLGWLSASAAALQVRTGGR